MESSKYKNFIGFEDGLSFFIKDSRQEIIFSTSFSEGLKINNYIYTFLEKLHISIITTILSIEYSLTDKSKKDTKQELKEDTEERNNKKLLHLYANKSNIKIFKIILSTLKIDKYKNISTLSLELWLGINILSNECFFIRFYNINRINSFKESKILKDIEEKYYKSLDMKELWI